MPIGAYRSISSGATEAEHPKALSNSEYTRFSTAVMRWVGASTPWQSWPQARAAARKYPGPQPMSRMRMGGDWCNDSLPTRATLNGIQNEQSVYFAAQVGSCSSMGASSRPNLAIRLRSVPSRTRDDSRPKVTERYWQIRAH